MTHAAAGAVAAAAAAFGMEWILSRSLSASGLLHRSAALRRSVAVPLSRDQSQFRRGAREVAGEQASESKTPVTYSELFWNAR